MSFFAAVVRDPEDGAELGDAELRDQRATLTGDGFLVLAPGDRERSSVVDGLGRVEVRPAGGDLEELGGRLVLGGLASRASARQLGGREVVSTFSCYLPHVSASIMCSIIGDRTDSEQQSTSTFQQG